MLNEIEEFKAYTGKPVYKCSGKRDLSFLGRFSFEMMKEFTGLSRVLTIIARGYMFRNGAPDVDYARRALCAWCSILDKKTAAPRRSGSSRLISVICMRSFPNWWIRREKAGFTGTFTRSKGSSQRTAIM